MSAKPRPVTATFPPPPLLSPVHLRPRSRTPSPLNSTASLLSILNHNSYESTSSPMNLFDDDSRLGRIKDQNFHPRFFVECKSQSGRQNDFYNERQAAVNELKSSSKNSFNVQRPASSLTSEERKRSRSMDVTKRNAQNVPLNQLHQQKKITSSDAAQDGSNDKVMKDKTNELSAWEKWMIQKAKEDRAKVERELKQQQMKVREEQRVRKDKDDKKKKTEKIIKEWIMEHDSRRKQEVEADMRKKQEEEQLKEKDKKISSEKAKAKYNEWMEKKVEEEANKKKEMMEKKEKEEMEKENRRKRSEEAFNEWVRKARSRPRTSPHSYGYTDGKLTGYYDAGAYPIPSYFNPVPWQPIEIPKYKAKSKAKKKQMPNNMRTDKYFC